MMMKKLLIFIACLSLSGHLVGCTSSDTKADSEEIVDFDAADLERLEGDEALEIVGDDSLMSDPLAEDALGESFSTAEITETTETTTAESTFGDDEATTEHTDIATTTEALPADPFESSTMDWESAGTDSSTTIVDSTTDYGTDTYSDGSQDVTTMLESSTTTETYTETQDSYASEQKPKNIPLQKMASTPWRSGGVLYNAIYFARPGDTLASVSQMIYGMDRTDEFKKGYPAYKTRDLRPGDKVYYNSPNRPNDSSRIITYYEDNGLAPEVYVTQEGDNIRSLSKEILGYDNAWKEIWSSNDVESKGRMTAGTELHYWRGGNVATAPTPTPQEEPVHQELAGMAQQQPPAEDQGMYGQEGMIPSEDQMMEQAQSDFPPPPPPEMDMAPPPPPPEVAQVPPPPPPMEALNPPAQQQAQLQTDEPMGMDSDTTMALAVVGLAAAGLAILIVIRKKRKQREFDHQAMNDTHVG